ncbi:Haemolymph juvenile hormone Hypothetical protein protein (JHBP) [Nesidiocoris tenuis]|uniref:Uncharacterized protein n=1 Tax=Nesidiocoris tenuis TaxID=355587 RepID=A0ABN7AZN8_9HEMI|nr:Haemolymph juvenile hormone Hypothetical protein protein (JHBP) [Nesidiocoris tenuis]
MTSWQSVAVSVFLYVAVNAKIPDYIKICKRSDPDISQCILNSIEAIRPKLAEGIPELDIPAIEPLHMPEMVISRGGAFKAIGTNITVHGASNFIIKALETDIDNIVYNASLHFPLISFDAIYDVDAKILAMPLKGKGPINANASDIEGRAVIKGHKQVEDGKTFVMFDELKLKLKMKNYQIRLENLFNGDKNLGEAVNAALNENKKELMNFMRPRAEELASKVLLERANKITRHFEYDELFPSD